MRKIFTAFLFAIVFTPIAAFSQVDTSFTVDIKAGEEVNEYFFEISRYEDGDEISSIKYWPGKPAMVNIIFLLKDDYAHYMEFDDYNFDGYLDIYLHDPCMILGNCFGKVFIFNGEQFKHDPRFDDMTSVTAIPESKMIFSSNRSAAGTLFNNETYQWEGNELVLVKRISQNLTDGEDMLMYLYKVEERDKNGNLVTVEEKILEEPNLE